MREILFRGKRLNDGEWDEGNLITGKWYINEREIVAIAPLDNAFYPHCEMSEWYEVDPNTISQSTGLCDKNGKKIFEGDIVNIRGDQTDVNWKDVNYNALIAFIDGGFCALDGTIECHGFRRYALARMDFDLEVIGNIYDNPELLEVDNGSID